MRDFHKLNDKLADRLKGVTKQIELTQAKILHRLKYYKGGGCTEPRKFSHEFVYTGLGLSKNQALYFFLTTPLGNGEPL